MSVDCKRVLPEKVAPALFVCLLGLLTSTAATAQKTDTVYLKNGDRLTVEVKELVRGEMRLKTVAFGTIYVKWEDVDRIETDKRLQVELSNGRQFYGPGQPSEEPGKLALDVDGETVLVDNRQIVWIQPIKGTKRLRGNLDNSLSLGFTYTQASDVMQWHVRASTQYRTNKYLVSASYDSMVTNNGTGRDSKRRDLSGNYFRDLGNRWLWYANASFQENDELGVDGRLLAGGGIGRFLAQTQSQEFVLGGGLTGNFENALGTSDPGAGGSDSDSSLEGQFFGEWSYFKLHTPKADVSIRATVFPSLSESGRTRGDARVRYRQEFIEDLFLNLTYYYNFDTDPPAGAASESDYGIVTSLEYQF